MFMKVIWPTVDYLSTVNTNLGLIRCLQHWHLVSLESKITLKFLVVSCIKILGCYWHSSHCTGIVLLQLLGFVLRVWSEGWFLGFNLDSFDVYHWGVGPTCQWKLIRWMTSQEISFLNLLRVIHVEWTGGDRLLYLWLLSRISLWD
jgi:Cholesterol-capturing domain